jgi:hypothetical protein
VIQFIHKQEFFCIEHTNCRICICLLTHLQGGDEKHKKHKNSGTSLTYNWLHHESQNYTVLDNTLNFASIAKQRLRHTSLCPTYYVDISHNNNVTVLLSSLLFRFQLCISQSMSHLLGHAINKWLILEHVVANV